MPDTLAANVTFRPAVAADIPRMTELIAGAHLPPLFIEEHLEGFVAVQQGDDVIACGGIEVYGDCAVIRSVVVAESGRGLGLGGRLAETLMQNARDAGVIDFYLFTADALPFWEHYGFARCTFDDWREPPRASWQYQFLSQNVDLVPEVITMRRKA